MPATESTWRNQKLLHVIFGWTSLLMLLATVWMLLSDHMREWRDYQTRYGEIDQSLTEWQLQTEESRLATLHLEHIEEELAREQSKLPPVVIAEQMLTVVEEDAAARGVAPPDLAPIRKVLAEWGESELPESKEKRDQLLYGRLFSDPGLVSLVDQAKYHENELVRQRKFRAADYDAARANLDLLIRDGEPQDRIDAAQKVVDDVRRDLDELTLQRERATAVRVRLVDLLNQIVGRENELKKQLSDQQQEVQRLQLAVQDRKSTFFTSSFPFLGKRWLKLPILDAFNSPHRIDNLWTKDLTLVNGSFGQVRRFDRCTTCHRGIDKSPASEGDPDFGPARELQFTIHAPSKPATDDEKEVSLSTVYGMTLADTGLLSPNDVTIRHVQPKSLAALAVSRDRSEVADGIQAGDVLIAVNSDFIHTPADARLFLLGPTAWDQSLNITVRRGLPQPFTAHPRQDLYVSSLSPHPLSVLGCTSCHEGQGTATAFQFASHTPNTFEQADEWSRNHHWFNNHHWIYPMYARRFMESTCIRCHHDVVELGPSERFPDAPAPKVTEGYQLVNDYGCYACHEINGFGEGGRRIGPDMRLEPNYFAAAAALRADPAFDTLDKPIQKDIVTLISHPDQSATRRRLHQFLVEQAESGASSLSPDSLLMAEQLQDIDNPGQLRKVGPSLRYVAHKLDERFLFDWIREPNHFRPTTRMPQFFGLWRHLESEPTELARSQRWEPIEILGVVTYLLDKSQPFEYISPVAGVERASAERGRAAFELRGCLACHRHSSFPDGKATQGPDLSNLGDKFASLADPRKGQAWLYSWLKEPFHYSPRTKMPNLFLEPITADGKTTDPAADIAAFLLQSRQGWQPRPDSITALTPDPQALDEVVADFLRAAYPADEVAEYLKTGIPESAGVSPVMPERELVGNASTNAKLNYIGRKTISKYGCFACHDIPGFEAAKPIGTALADWGRKEATTLAFEHIKEYLGMGHLGTGHGGEEPEPSSADHGHGTAAAPEFYDRQKDDDSDEAFFHMQIGWHDRSGFLWQKLREPRSFDYMKTANKPYNDRLRMPQFSFDDHQREAIMTFVLGLVSEPPREQFVYNPDPRKRAIQQGLVVLEKYNCGGCHILDTERWELEFEPGELEEPVSIVDFPFVIPTATPDQLAASAEASAQRGTLRATIHGLPAISNEDGTIEVWDEEGDPIDPEEQYDPETLLHPFDLWRSVPLDGQLYEMGIGSLVVPANTIRNRWPTRGGDLTWLLLPRVVELEKEANPGANGKEAWGWLPPPLIGEGKKVRSEWLHDFLLAPFPIRPSVFLRMPQFNMSPAEAQALVDYFNAKDDLLTPFDFDSRTTAAHLALAQAEFEKRAGADRSRLNDAMKIVTDINYCTKCHLIGDFIPEGTERAKAPDLAVVQPRLRPEWVRAWIANPKRFLPYSNMPVNIPYDPESESLGGVSQHLFPGTSIEQLDGVVDLLMNFNAFTTQKSNITEIVKENTAAAASATDEGTSATP